MSSRAFRGIPQAARSRMARVFLAELSDEDLLKTTAWKLCDCWELTQTYLADTLLIAEKLKRGLAMLTDLTPEQRRRQVDLSSIDLKAIAAGPIMDPGQIYLPAGKLSMAETKAREAAQVRES